MVVAWAIKDFGGLIPRTGSRNLPQAAAEQAANCDLASGYIAGLPIPELIRDFSTLPVKPSRAYRLPGPDPTFPDAWLALPSPYSSVARSPLANDPLRRVYWTNPGQGAFWNTYQRVLNGNTGSNAPYTLGFIAPTAGVTVAASTKGEAFFSPQSRGGTLALASGTFAITLPMADAGPLGEGTHTVTVLDPVSQATATSVPFLVTTSPTNLVATNPLVKTGASMTVSGTFAVTSTDYNPASIDYAFDGGSWNTVTPTIVGSTYNFSVTAPGADGAHTIQTRFTASPAILSNVFSFVSATANTLYVNPINVHAPGDVATVSGFYVGAGTPASISWTIDGGATASPGAVGSATISGGTWSQQITTPLVGTHIITFSAATFASSATTWSVQLGQSLSVNQPAPVAPNGTLAFSGAFAGITPMNLLIAFDTDVTSGSVNVSRSYCFTYVDEYGQESSPSPPSGVVDGLSDGTWTISGLPTTPVPAPPAGTNYPRIVSLNLYRTLTGTTTGAQFYLVKNIVYDPGTFPSGGVFTDTIPDTAIVNNLTLISSAWVPPLPTLDGLTALPGGMLAGFTGNTVHFCEPDRPHAWPAAYDQSVQYDIMGLAVWQQSLVVLTSGYPSTGSGNSPSNFVFTQVRVPEPCIARGSIITDLMGVYYASQNGLVMLNYFGMQNQTLSLFTKNIWLEKYHAANIIACRHRSQYLAVNSDSGGFVIDYSEQRLGVMPISSLAGVSAIWNDEYTGDAYVMAGGIVYRWDSPNTPQLVFRWRSKQFYGPAPVSLGACQISLGPQVAVAVDNPDPLGNGDPTLVLPDGINAIFNLYAGPNGANLIMTKNLTSQRMIFRLPSGFKAFDWQFEVVGRASIHAIEVASTMKELKGV